MITEHEEIARYRIAEQLQAAETRARRRASRRSAVANRRDTSNSRHGLTAGSRRGLAARPRHGLATALRRLADRLEPASRRLSEPQPHHRSTGLSIVR